MYYNLVQALKRRLILELVKSYSTHAVYKKITPFIQESYSFEERPQFGIVVKSSGANKVVLSADNYIGTIQSYVMLAYVGQATFPLEWVREDLKCVAKHKGMPTPPGVYYLEVLVAPTHPSEVGKFVIDPLITIVDEPVFVFRTTAIEVEAQLQNVPLANTLRLYENRKYLLQEGTDYTIDYQTGKIQILYAYTAESLITADYRYAEPSRGPIDFRWNTADSKTLPGIVLAFGKRAAKGDKVAIVVYKDRVDTAKAYGGKSEVSFDLDVIASDKTQMMEIADLVFMYLWTERKSALEFEGIEILDVSISGEAEEVADETGETFFYQTTCPVQFRADWEVHVPLPLTISKVLPTKVTAIANSIFFGTYGVLENRNDDYERLT